MSEQDAKRSGGRNHGTGDASQCLPRKNKGGEVLLWTQVAKPSAFSNIISVNTNRGGN
jgi:hypothetical protein